MTERASPVLVVFCIGEPVAVLLLVLDDVGDFPENSFIPHGWFHSMYGSLMNPGRVFLTKAR